MKLILTRKLNSLTVGVLLYFSFCFSEFYAARGSLAYALMSMSGMYSTKFFSNSILVFLIGGLMPFFIYEIVTSFIMNPLRSKFGAVADDLRYSLRFFYFAANISIGLLSLIFYISPIISVYGAIIIPFIVTTVFFALFLVFACKHYLQKDRIASLLMIAGGAYLVLGAITTVLKIVGMV